jgi:hypothetical protein
VLGHGDLERGELPDADSGNFRRHMTVDDAYRQMPEEIDHPRMVRRVVQRDQLVQLGLDPLR